MLATIILGLPDTHRLTRVARYLLFGEGNSNCRQSHGVWVSEPSRSLGV
jgi:hypothetical protein